MDSSMAAILLLQKGYEVIGATLQTHTEAADPHLLEAQKLAASLNIKHYLIDCREEFRDKVITYFANEYINGRTPNPCIHCNPIIKWKYLLDLANKLNCGHVATGHYVQIHRQNNRFYIKKGVDQAKDQSYFLWNLDQEVLSRAIFPLGDLQKQEVRQLTHKAGYKSIAKKKESMGVCFLNGTDYREYLKQILPENHPSLQPGPVIDSHNRTIGHHEGYPNYTIGQRRGIEGIANGQCVVDIDPERKALITGQRNQLFTSHVELKDYSITPDASLWQGHEVFIRIRGFDSVPGYHGNIKVTDTGLTVSFNSPVWAITPGQSIVIYQDDIIIGGGIV